VTTATPRFNGGGDNRFVLVSLVAVATALFVCYSGGGDYFVLFGAMIAALRQVILINARWDGWLTGWPGL
jgi:hypothetical protein